MHLTPPHLLTFLPPLDKYDAYAFALVFSSVSEQSISDFANLRNGPPTPEMTRWMTGAFVRRSEQSSSEAATAAQGEETTEGTAKKGKGAGVYVIRDMDIEVPIPDWDGIPNRNGGMSPSEREEAKEKTKGRGMIVAFSEWAWMESDWYEKYEEKKQKEKKKANGEVVDEVSEKDVSEKDVSEKDVSEKDVSEKEEAPPPRPTQGGIPELRILFTDKIMDLRKRLVGGKEHYILNNLCTLPSHHRRGCGAKLTRVIFPYADGTSPSTTTSEASGAATLAGEICYLDASPMGYPVYLKCGFKELDKIEIDKGDWGGVGIHRHVGMIRYPQTE